MGCGSATHDDWPRTSQTNQQFIYKIGIYGWRKRCLYVFILLLMVTVIVNVALTVWILKIMDFNMHGMGKLRLEKNKVRVEGDAEFLRSLRAAHLTATQDSPLYIESARNITFNARDSTGKIVNKLTLGQGQVEAYAEKFVIKNNDGDILFSVNRDNVVLGTEKLTVSGSGGVSFKGSIQTPLVQSGENDLRIESPTGGLYLSAPENINIRSHAGPISMESASDIHLESLNKAIRFDAGNITMRGIQISQALYNGTLYPEAFQMCVCKTNGKLFLAPSRGNCHATTEICR